MAEWSNFENAVYEGVKEALAGGHLPFNPSDARVRRNASYLSGDGKRLISIEVSVEVYRQGATEPCLISLWECKYQGTRKVEIGVIRELKSKIEEIGVSRCRGAVVTSNGFQSGAIELAEQHGIWLLNLDERLVWITKYAKGANSEERRVLFANYWLDDFGKAHSDAPFSDLVRFHCRRGLDACAVIP